MMVMGSAMLSDWATLDITAPLFIAYAEAEQRHNSLPSERSKSWGKGTVDAFNIALLSQALATPTEYAPANSLIPELAGVLQHWRSTDEAELRSAMQQAAACHLSRCKNNTKRVQYEFSTFSTGFARRAAGRASPARPHLLLAAAEARLKADFPGLR